MIEPFTDRSDYLFGRAADVRWLLDRAIFPGLTSLSARPLMGKTWTLIEVARQWQEYGNLVGYHESKGAESSHILYTVANLYARWLSDSSLREQAVSLWVRHKDGFAPRVGQMLGALFEKIGGVVGPANIASLVRQAFDGLGDMQKDLLAGGLQVASLPYDQAKALVNLVAEVSGRRILLILDAWEKAPTPRAEHATLEAFLKHLEDWPSTHLLLSIRHPELPTIPGNEAIHRVRDLRKLSPAVQVRELTDMDLSDQKEQERLLKLIRTRVNATRQVPDEGILRMIDAYPGVLHFWLNEANRLAMTTDDDLRRVAHDAQLGRYAEFEQLLALLPDTRIAIAARLAFLPRLDKVRWDSLSKLVLGAGDLKDVEGLTDIAVLLDERVPTYGHDTRQAAARSWFIANRTPMMRRISERLVEAIAIQMPIDYADSLIYLETLLGCKTSANDCAGYFDISDSLKLIFAAASCALGDDENERKRFDQCYLSEVQQRPELSPLIVRALLNRGGSRLEKHDVAGAIADYSAVLEIPAIPIEMVALALDGRGSARLLSDSSGATADFTEVIQLPGAPRLIVANALLGRAMSRRHSDVTGEEADYAEFLARPDVAVNQVAFALYRRGFSRVNRDDFDGGISDFTALIELSSAPASMVAKALLGRAYAKELLGDTASQVSDFTAVIELEGASTEQMATAFYSRALVRSKLGDGAGQLADYSAVIELPGASTRDIAESRINRGAAFVALNDFENAMKDFSAVLEMHAPPRDQIAMAIFNRGHVKYLQGDLESAIVDFTEVIQMDGARVNQIAGAFILRMSAKDMLGDVKEVEADTHNLREWMDSLSGIARSVLLENTDIRLLFEYRA